MLQAHVLIQELDRFIAERDSVDTCFTFIFMGGEPLLNFEVFKNAVDFISTRRMMAHFEIRLVTNGLLIDDDISRWLNHHNKISVAISTDDVSRLVHSNVANAYAKMVIYPALLESGKALPCVCEVAKINRYAECVCADGVNWLFGAHKDLLHRFFNELIRLFASNLQWTPPNLLCAALWRFGDSIQTCNPGVNAYCIDPDGKWFDCNRETPIYNNAGFRLNCSLKSAPDLKVRECPNCKVRSLCAICPAVKASIQNEDQAQVKCFFVKESIRASLEYQSRIAIMIDNKHGDSAGCRFLEDRPWLDYKIVSKGCVDVAKHIGEW